MWKKIFIIVMSLVGTFSLFMFYSLYWKWDFNTEGVAFDPVELVTYKESSSIWGLISFAFFLPLIFFILKKFLR